MATDGGADGRQNTRSAHFLGQIAHDHLQVSRRWVMVTSAIYDHAARKRCYELLAEAFRLANI
jgi:hypothetical protein